MKKGHDCGGAAFKSPEVLCTDRNAEVGQLRHRRSLNDEFQLFLFRKCRFDHIIHVGRNDPAS
jgi:hypothetical protein